MLIETMGVIGAFLTPVFSLDKQGYCVYIFYAYYLSFLKIQSYRFLINLCYLRHAAILA